MKKNAGRLSKKLFAAMMAGTMMTAMVGMTVSAEDIDGVYSPESITINKTVTTDGNTYAPATTFNFAVNTAEKTTYDGNVVYAGEEDGLTLANNGITFEPGESVGGSYTGSTMMNVEISEFQNPGIYHYTVKEVIPESVYEGIQYDNTVYDVYVYITTDDEGNLSATNVVSVNQTTGTKGDLSFTNNYGSGDNNSTHDVKITKDVTGNQGDRDEDFTFKVTVTGATGEKYKVVVNGNTGEATSIISGEEATFTLSDDDTIQIFGLSENDTVKVDEEDCSADGYTTTYVNTNTETTVTNDKDNRADYISGTITADGATITVTNTKNASTPTGIAMTYGPYALMVALAGGMAALFLRRRNREDY